MMAPTPTAVNGDGEERRSAGAGAPARRRAPGSPAKGSGVADRWTEKLFMNFAAAGAFGDERLVPAVFQELAASFNTSMSELGVISLSGMLACSLTYPLSGIVGDSYYRGRVVLWSLIAIAVTTAMVAMAQTYSQLIFCRILVRAGAFALRADFSVCSLWHVRICRTGYRLACWYRLFRPLWATCIRQSTAARPSATSTSRASLGPLLVAQLPQCWQRACFGGSMAGA